MTTDSVQCRPPGRRPNGRKGPLNLSAQVACLTEAFSLLASPPPAPTLIPGSRCESMGSRRSYLSPLGSSLKCHLNQDSQSQSTRSPPRRTVVRQAGVRARKGGWQGYSARPPIFLLSFCLSISKLIHSSPIGTTAALDKTKSKPAVPQGDQQV